MNLFEFMKKFSTEDKAINYFVSLRYKDGAVCPHCGGTKTSHRSNNVKFFQCNSCNNSFSVFKGTIFEKSDTDFRKWLFAINLFLNAKKGI
jgi:transposase-like protein